jgi:hypothetical protein
MSHLIVPAILVEIGLRFNSWMPDVTGMACAKASGKTIALFRCTQLILYPQLS